MIEHGTPDVVDGIATGLLDILQHTWNISVWNRICSENETLRRMAENGIGLRMDYRPHVSAHDRLNPFPKTFIYRQ